ncbi:hypothetical protein P2P98_03180 [Microbacterium sp. Kw_RZR3]|uniref:hypothetical protein n=1 Tax=Microbacterium sp. Kw_RZR3 TaxID=3032903 RepID=UPI0023DC7D7D|nr:hypothetical protein [Microbacterium sp. Kw_RZR3]MDF2045152.1 hypothetical protein [Microbacterium sp. Kw_RZR3]
MVNIKPSSAAEAPLIEFNIEGFGKFNLPVLGQPGVPFGITNAFGVFQSAQDGGNDQQKLAAWSLMTQTLADTYPSAVRILSRLDGDDVAAVFTAWGNESKKYVPGASSE